MPDITKEIKAFKEAVYGEEVRSGFISVAEKVNEVATDMEVKRDSGYFKGEKGDKGDKGDPAATITINEVITGAPGTNAEITNVGTVSDVKLNFTIPRGADGSSAAYQLPPATATELGGIKSGGDIAVSADGTVSLTDLLKRVYPIGKIEVTCTNINPATYLGFGAWEQFGQGRALFGVDSADSDFNAPGKTGGNKTHKLVAAEIPSNEWKQAERVAAYGDSVGNIGHTGEAAQAFSLLPPYVTVYFWRRTA